MPRTGQFPRSVICVIACSLLLASCLPSSPTPTFTPTLTPAPAPLTPPTASPTSPPTSPPLTTSSPDHTPAMRPEFASDLELFPNATHYEIELTVDLDAPAVTGHELADYTNTTDTFLDTLYLRLFPNTPGYGGDMTVTNAEIDGQPVEPVLELGGSALRLPLDQPLEPGANLVLKLDFVTVLPISAGEGYRQLGYYDSVVALANAYPIIPVHDGEGAGPELGEGWNIEIAPTYGDAVYSETSLYTVQVTAPASMTLAVSGVCAPPVLNPDDGNATWSCVTGPVRDFNAILGPDYRVESKVVEGVTVNSLFYSNHRGGGELALDWAAEAVNVFSARFGPYPFAELDVVETPTYAGGVEYPGLVVINSGYYETLSRDMEWVVVHEVGHQWWYSLVGNDQVDDPWLDEALTQYSTLLYYEDRYGRDLAANLLDEVFRQPYDGLVQSGHDAPVGMPVAAYSDADYGSVVYRKGPLYFHELRQAVGDESFGAILQTYFEHNRYGVAGPEDWLAAVKEVVGDEHRPLYEQWIVGTEQ